MAIHAALAEELTEFQNSNDRFLALVGNDHDLQSTFLNVVNRVRWVSLSKDDLVLAIPDNGFSLAHLGKKFLGIKSTLFGFGCHVLRLRNHIQILALQTANV